MSHTATPSIAGNTAPPLSPGAPVHPSAYPSDEQILGIVDDAALSNASVNAESDPGATQTSAAVPQSEAFTAPATDLPDWLARASAAAPEAAPQLATLWQRASALETFDRAYYGADAAAQQSLVAQLYADDPAALRSMVAAAQQIISVPANGARVTPPSAPPVAPTLLSANSRNENADRSVGATNAAPDSSHTNNFDPAAYAQFEQSTNDAVVTDVNRAIERALDRALPDNIADGARRRIAGDTLAEVHAALRGDRDLAAQVAESLRTGQFSAATRDGVARLIATRARGVVPEAARRVIGEWTGSVLASHRDRAAKTQAASARVDVTGGALPAPVPRRAVAPSDINYRATSDEDILSW